MSCSRGGKNSEPQRVIPSVPTMASSSASASAPARSRERPGERPERAAPRGAHSSAQPSRASPGKQPAGPAGRGTQVGPLCPLRGWGCRPVLPNNGRGHREGASGSLGALSEALRKCCRPSGLGFPRGHRGLWQRPPGGSQATQARLRAVEGRGQCPVRAQWGSFSSSVSQSSG